MGQCNSKSNKASEPQVQSDKAKKHSVSDDKSSEMVEKDEELLKVLADIPLLQSLPETDHRKLAHQFEERTFKVGEELMKQGAQGAEFFIIVSGKCKVVVSSAATDTDDAAPPTSQEIAQLSDGDYCGEQALLHDATRGATVSAVTETKCLVLQQKAFQEIVTEANIRFAKRDAKRDAISAELLKGGASAGPDASDVPKEAYAKSEQTAQWLIGCVKDNTLFTNLDAPQRALVVQNMHRRELQKDDYLIVQGEEGSHFYVVEQGQLNVTVKDVGQVDSLEAGSCVGELALLYNAPRAASVQVVSDGASVWAVARQVFRRALMDAHTSTQEQNLGILKKCELLQPLLSSELQLLDQALEKQSFAAGQTIFNEGDDGDRFYLVKNGTVEGYTSKDESKFEISVGGFFGERALLVNEPRAATLKAVTKAELLTLSREDFTLLLGPLCDIMQRNLEEYEKPKEERKPMGHISSNDTCALDEFQRIGILGRGAFGTVKLVVDPGTEKSYALKAIRKNQVVELGQQAHILNEKKVMQMLENRFLVNLCSTYKDESRVYFLLEACLGGELFTILRKMRSFDEPTARFFAGCVVEAFDYMHQRDIIYRDLKPENLVLTAGGYLKVTDFGFAKIVPNKTFTLCGTPDYLAPEIVTGQGHGKGVDWWTLGVFVYEMLASFPPFFDDEPMMSYRKIIQGKYKFPRYLSQHSKDLIAKFLKTKPTKRYGVIKGGAALIRAHPWFKDFDWKALRAGNMKAPIRPKVKNPVDMSNFDHFQEKDEDLAYKGDPDLGWDKDF